MNSPSFGKLRLSEPFLKLVDFCKLENSGLKVKVKLAFKTTFFQNVQDRELRQLPQFSSKEDLRRNCEKFIHMFKDWCELNGW